MSVREDVPLTQYEWGGAAFSVHEEGFKKPFNSSNTWGSDNSTWGNNDDRPSRGGFGGRGGGRGGFRGSDWIGGGERWGPMTCFNC